MLRTANAKGNWAIFIQPRRNKSIDSQMGNATFIMGAVMTMESELEGFSRPYSLLIRFSAALIQIVEHFNICWVKMDNHPLDLKALRGPSFHFCICAYLFLRAGMIAVSDFLAT